MSSRLTEFSFLALAAKKAATYVLEQNWFADPLEVKSSLASFDNLIREISNDFSFDQPISCEILPVEVPKSVSDGKLGRRFGRIHTLRHLAHLPFKFQVSATAILMMIGEQWDARFGPRQKAQKSILGNRLDCIDTVDGPKFRLGSRTTYRFWADDYSQFVSQTSEGFNQALESISGKRRICLVSTDLRNFYPSIDLDSLRGIVSETEGLTETEVTHIKIFFDSIQQGMKSAGLSGLPQGMTASGHFANIYLHEFDNQVVDEISSMPSLKGRSPKVHFYARYVDDIRIIISYEPLKGGPSKKVESHPVYLALEHFLKKFQLEASKEKTHILDLDRNGSKLTEGLLAEHMQDLSEKAYGALIPEKSANLAKMFELLFSIDSTAERKPPSNEVQRNKYNPVIDGPGVRPDSRKRFAAGRFRKLYLTYKDCSLDLPKTKDRFVSEMFREWKSNPSQIRLLYYAFDLSDYDEELVIDALEFLEDYPVDPINLDAASWMPFIRASIIRTFIDRAVKTNVCPPILSKLAINCIEHDRPWYLRTLAWQLLACYKITLNRALHDQSFPKEGPPQRAYNFWRFCMSPQKANKDLLRNYVLVAKSIPISRKALDQIIATLLKSVNDQQVATSLVTDNIKEVIRVSDLTIRSKEARALALRLGASITPSSGKKKSWRTFVNKPFEKSLLQRILDQEFRDPRSCVDVIIRIIRQLEIYETELEAIASKGLINPFNFKKKQEGGYLRFDPKIGYSGWVSPDWRTVNWLSPEFMGRNWAWPIGMLIRLCLTANRSLVYGAPPSHRYSMYFNQSRLCREDGFAPESLMKILTRLLAWPGTLIQPYRSLKELRANLESILEEMNELSSPDSIRLLDGPNPLEGKGTTRLRLLTCQVFNGLQKSEMLTDPIRSRKMVLYALDEVEHRIRATHALGIQDGDPEIASIVIFPELSVPPEAFGDIFRFVKKNKTIVLFGAWPSQDAWGATRNTLHWIFPGKDPSGRVDIQAIKQHKIFPISAEMKKLGIVPANPKIIWRIPFQQACRVAAINCYELTNIGIKSLLTGRVELINTIAFNEDVSLFDGQAKSYAYDFYGFVSIINSGLKGGSCIYAPYRGEEYKKQKLHLHGEKQFVVPVVEIDVNDFRAVDCPNAKTPPAGFAVKS